MTVGGGGGQFDPKWCHFSLASIPSASLLPVATCHTTFVTISQFPTKQVCNLSHSPSPYNITIFQNLNAWTFRDWHLSGGQSAQPLLLPKLHCCLPGPPALHRGYQGRALRYWIIFFIMSDYPALYWKKGCLWGLLLYLSIHLYLYRFLLLRLHPQCGSHHLRQQPGRHKHAARAAEHHLALPLRLLPLCQQEVRSLN